MVNFLTKYFNFSLCLVALLFAVSCEQQANTAAGDQPLAIAVDGIIKSKTEMEYRIVLLSSKEKPRMVKKFKEIAEIIWGSKKEYAYLDQQGYVWMVTLADLSPIKNYTKVY